MSVRPRKADRNTRIEIQFLEGIRRRGVGSRVVLESLGDLYTRAGRFEEGLEVDLELTRMVPDDATIRYNLACSLAQVGRKEEAFEALNQALDLGYGDVEWMVRDADLEPLRNDPRFAKLVIRAKTETKRHGRQD